MVRSRGISLVIIAVVLGLVTLSIALMLVYLGFITLGLVPPLLIAPMGVLIAISGLTLRGEDAAYRFWWGGVLALIGASWLIIGLMGLDLLLIASIDLLALAVILVIAHRLGKR